MKKSTKIILAVFLVLLVSFIIWNRFYSPTQWGRCIDNSDCAPKSPEAGFSYVCEDGICVQKPIGTEPEKQCITDDDCVAASCCHASEAVNTEYAPDCEDVFCTQECVPGTLDCGQGEIRCVSGRCEAIIYQE